MKQPATIKRHAPGVSLGIPRVTAHLGLAIAVFRRSDFASPVIRVVAACISFVAVVAGAAACRGEDGDRRNVWWSLQSIVRPNLPTIDSSWIRSPIDAFILEKLLANGLAPSQDADRRTLIRRLTYDLHGLPPTSQEIEAFIEDDRPDAYERLVDRLLESPRYGERWARHWLDIVHFGESHGYDKDKPRLNAWPYRDYVIRALNSDKPYGRFAQQQIAGDVLDRGDPDGVVATGFIAAGPWDFVGHVELPETKSDGLIARYNDRDDMLSTTMSTFVSLTVHCARCHDHKFDPITQRDYYGLQAVFAGVDRADRPFDRDPMVHRRRQALSAERSRFDKQIQAILQVVAQVHSPAIDRLDREITTLKERLAKASVAKDASPSNGYHSAIMPTADHVKWVQVDLGRVAEIDRIRLVPARPTDFPDTPGFGFPLRYRVELSNDPAFDSKTVIVDHSASDQPSPADQSIEFPIAVTPARYVRMTATRLWRRSNDYVFALAELEALCGSSVLSREARVTALDSIEAGRWSTKYLVDGFSSRKALGTDQSDSPELRERVRLESELARSMREHEQELRRNLDDATWNDLESCRQSLARVQSELAALPAPSLVYAAASDFARQGNFSPAGAPRSIRLLNRGDVRQPGAEISPSGPACVTQLAGEFQLADASDEGERRVALANWITDPRNPLTWRSIVNRVWQYHFGQGIVDTPNDFGRMGAAPTHPELLDWLASWFIENGESLKALHRLIVSSSVYRQSSGLSFGQVADGSSKLNAGADATPITDTENRLLGRMNRARLDAESLRDAALYVSGQLDCHMGGPSVQQFYFKDDHSPVYDYTQFDWDGVAARRRSIYRFIVRSVPDPFMDSFDCADACQLTPKRTTTLTALQALALLNNPFMVRQAERFAERLRAMTPDVAAQLREGCVLVFGRMPTAAEAAEWSQFITEFGLVNWCRLVLNSNEFIFVD